MKTFAAIWTISLFLAFGAKAADCQDQSFEDVSFTVCKADPLKDDIRLFLNDDSDAPLGTFSNLADQVSAEGNRLVLAMNAGMYHPDRSPGRPLHRRSPDAFEHRHPRGPGQLRPSAQRRALPRRNHGKDHRKPRLRVRPAPLFLCHAIRPHAGDRRQAASTLSAQFHIALYPKRGGRHAPGATSDGHLEQPGQLPPLCPLLSAMRLARPMRFTWTARSRASMPPCSTGTTSAFPWAPCWAWSIDLSGAEIVCA